MYCFTVPSVKNSWPAISRLLSRRAHPLGHGPLPLRQGGKGRRPLLLLGPLLQHPAQLRRLPAQSPILRQQLPQVPVAGGKGQHQPVGQAISAACRTRAAASRRLPSRS